MTYMPLARRFVYLAMVTVIFACPAHSFAQLTVLISGGFAGPYRDVIKQFEQKSGITITTLTGGSQGDGPDTIGAQLDRGVKADIVILNRTGLSALITQNRVIKGSDRDLARTPVSVAIRAGSLKPDISTVDAFRNMLVDAKTFAVTGSSEASTRNLLTKLGITDRVVVRVAGRVTDVIALVANGEIGLAIMPSSEIVNMPGVELAGPVPLELQRSPVYAAAIVTGTSQHTAADQLISYLLSDAMAPALRKFLMER